MTELSATEIADRVAQLRTTVIVGTCIDMLPYGPEHDAEVVRLRSLPNVRYFMNIKHGPTPAEQIAWREGYSRRHNDVMWVIRDKSGRICGTNRLYGICGRTAEKGSQIVDPEIALVLPAALESDMRIIDTAFNMFHVEQVTAQIRRDNTQVKSMNARFGFIAEGESEIRGVKYDNFSLARDEWNPSLLQEILNHWAHRYE